MVLQDKPEVVDGHPLGRAEVRETQTSEGQRDTITDDYTMIAFGRDASSGVYLIFDVDDDYSNYFGCLSQEVECVIVRGVIGFCR